MHNTILDYTPEEKDLGILVTSKFGFKAHQTYILIRQVHNLIFYDELVILLTIKENAAHYTYHLLEAYLAIVPKYGALLVRPLSLLKLFKNAVLSGFTGKASHPIMKVNIWIN